MPCSLRIRLIVVAADLGFLAKVLTKPPKPAALRILQSHPIERS